MHSIKTCGREGLNMQGKMIGQKTLRETGGREVGYAAQAACLLEVAAPKPGNVNRYSDFMDLFLEDFLLSAAITGSYMEKASGKAVGETVLGAVASTQEIIGTNTNLGIILLFAPVAKAYGSGNLHKKLKDVLASLTVEDSINVYRAVSAACAGGMGKVAQADISTIPEITLRESMLLAQERDSVAREYVTDYEITFGLGRPVLQALLDREYDFPAAVVQLYLTLLAEIPDSLIARKNGAVTAAEVSKRAAAVLRSGGASSEKGIKMIGDFDRYLRQQGNKLNPGTTADLTAAIVFVYFLENGLQKWRSIRRKSWHKRGV